MIGVVGFMSSGKTYFAVEQMLFLLASNHTVVSNVRLKCQAVTKYLRVPCVMWKRLLYTLVDSDEVQLAYHAVRIDDYWAYPQGSPRGSSDYDANMVYVFLDEASSVFDSMVQARDSNIVKVATWARQTRKRGIEVVLLMQFASELNKRLRTHIVEYIYCNNSNNIKLPVVGMGLPAFLRNMSVRQRYSSDGVTPIGDSVWRRFRSEIYDCYTTSAIVVGSEQVSPHTEKIDYSTRDSEIYQRKVLIFLFVLLFAHIFYFVLLVAV